MGRNPGVMHAAKVEESPRLQNLLRELEARGDAGITTWEIIEVCHIVSPSTAIAELRKNGYVFTKEYEGRSNNDRQIHRYVLIGRQ